MGKVHQPIQRPAGGPGFEFEPARNWSGLEMVVSGNFDCKVLKIPWNCAAVVGYPQSTVAPAIRMAKATCVKSWDLYSHCLALPCLPQKKFDSSL